MAYNIKYKLQIFWRVEILRLCLTDKFNVYGLLNADIKYYVLERNITADRYNTSNVM
jgi:hypothetical protein